MDWISIFLGLLLQAGCETNWDQPSDLLKTKKTNKLSFISKFYWYSLIARISYLIFTLIKSGMGRLEIEAEKPTLSSRRIDIKVCF
jgi:hypothetical protein